MQDDAVDAVDELRERLRRHTPDRHPLKHATAQFHLGTVLLGRGALDEAEESFTAAAALFGARGARGEQAKALNGLGATLREAGRLKLAARALEHAAAGLAAAGLALDEGAARFNLGLVLRDGGDAEGAVGALQRALELLDPALVAAQAAAASRELGATRLVLGDLAGAEAALSEAVALADRAGDQQTRGDAANVLGLALLGTGRAEDAAAAFTTAVAASPRALRPEAFAMAKANLAVALERTGSRARARLAARQALGAPAVPDPVRAQAAAVLERLGADPSDLHTVLEIERDPQRRAQLAREELVCSADADERRQAADARAWLQAHAATTGDPAEVAELWLGALLELAPEQLEQLVRRVIAAAGECDGVTRDDFREAVNRAMPRFHVPQWMRLQDVFADAAEELGDLGPWR